MTHFFLLIFLLRSSILTLCVFCIASKEHPELESQFVERVQETIKYTSTIDDFDKLVDPQTLTRHCLGLEPSNFVLRTIR